MKHAVWIVAALITAVTSCATNTVVVDDEFPELRRWTTDDGVVYESLPSRDDALIIVLDGGVPASTIGFRIGDGDFTPSFFWFVLERLGDRAMVVTPEKFHAEPGGWYQYDEEFLLAYTADNLIVHYARLIDAYLEEHPAQRVYLFGASEGGMVLPAVYNSLEQRSRITKMVSAGAGGFNSTERFQVLAESGVETDPVTLFLHRNFHLTLADIHSNPDSIEHTYVEIPYRYWYSFITYTPNDHFADIDIPVLFVHGRRDSVLPVESTEAVESRWPNKPYEYVYFEDMGHGPRGSESQTDEFFAAIEAWLFDER
ncbi:MAG: alpha/beta fold hydrolase [Spirochaetota bacterium]